MTFPLFKHFTMYQDSDKKKETYKRLAKEQHRLIMLMMERGVFPFAFDQDKKVKKAMKAYAKKCLTSPLILKLISEKP